MDSKIFCMHERKADFDYFSGKASMLLFLILSKSEEPWSGF